MAYGNISYLLKHQILQYETESIYYELSIQNKNKQNIAEISSTIMKS